MKKQPVRSSLGATMVALVVLLVSAAVAVAAPVISRFDPPRGPVGSFVIVSGTGFSGATAVQFNTINAPGFIVQSDTRITVRVPVNATSGPVAVTTDSGTATFGSFTVTGALDVTAWGYDGSGQVSGAAGVSDVVAIAGGTYHSLALKADGSVVAWGSSSENQIAVPVGLSNVVAIAAGESHTLALKADGSVVAWGRSSENQIAVPVGLSNVVAIAAGGFHSLALKADGSVVAWGHNGSGQSNVPSGLSTVVAIAGGGHHSVALKADGSVVAWGYNDYGQSNIPVGLSSVAAIAAGSYHSLALKADGSVIAWGHNGSGQVSGAAGVSNAVAIAGGGYHSLALKADGSVVAWGHNDSGQSNVPSGLSNVVAIAAGFFHSLALVPPPPFGISRFDPPRAPVGSFVVISGSRFSGATAVQFNGVDAPGFIVQSAKRITVRVPAGATSGTISVTTPGEGSTTSSRSFTVTGALDVTAWGNDGNGQVSGASGVSDVVAVAGGSDHSLALKADGSVVAWGDNGYGQTSVPGGLSSVVAIAAGSYHSLALKADGSVVAWGYNGYGETNIPVGLSNVVAIAAGGFHNLALKADGSVVAWGYNGYGQTSVPVGLSSVVAIAAGNDHSLALKADDSVVAWGNNGNGQTTVPSGLSSVAAIAAGGTHSLALVPPPPFGISRFDPPRAPVGSFVVISGSRFTGATAVAFNGVNAPGFVVQSARRITVRVPAGATSGTISVTTPDEGSTTSSRSFTVTGALAVMAWGNDGSGQVSGAESVSNAVAVAGGGDHSLALKADGSVVAWGYNGQGQTSVPGGLSNVVAIAAGAYHSLALKADGSVVAWGDNGYGQSSVPGGLSSVVAIAAGHLHSLALKADGSVAGWGYNGQGQTNIPVGLSNVVAIAAGAYAYHSLALKADGSVAGWGYNGYGETNIPVGLSNVAAIAAGHLHSLALKADGSVAGWGYNGNGETNIPVGLSSVVAIAAGAHHNLALKADDSVVAWGYNGNGLSSVPDELNNAVAIAAGGYHSLAVAPAPPPSISRLDPPRAPAGSFVVITGRHFADTTAVQFNGVNAPGFIVQSSRRITVRVPAGASSGAVAVTTAAGTGTFSSFTVTGAAAVAGWGDDELNQVSGATGVSNVVAIAAGAYHSVALKANGSVVAWGFNGSNQTRVPLGLGSVVAIAAGIDHTLVLKANGSVVAWGHNDYGQVSGAAGLSNVVAIAAGDSHNLALKADGSVVAWGDNGYGQINVPGLSNVVAIATGAYHSLALQADGSVVAWGYDGSGQVSGAQDVTGAVAIAGGGYHSLALKADGTVVAWGDDSFDQVGGVPATSEVIAITAGYAHSLEIVPLVLPPGISGATTREDVQTTSGLVITRTAGSGTEVTHYKITAITNGTLYASDGTTVIANDTFIAVGDGGTTAVKFTPDLDMNSPASDTFGFTAQASRSNSDAGLGGGTVKAAVTVTEVNDPATASNDTLGSVGEDSGQRTIAFSDLTGNDSKGPANESGQTLTITAVSNAVGGTASISGTDVLFTPGAGFNGTASFNYVVRDNGTTNAVADPRTGTGTVSFTVTAVNDAPVLDLNGGSAGIDFSASYTGGGTPVRIVNSSGLSVSDVDDTNLESATVTLTNRPDGANEVLAASASGAILAADISYAGGILTITRSAPLADYQAVLRSVTYTNTASNPNTTARTITFVVNDGEANSAVATTTLTVSETPSLVVTTATDVVSASDRLTSLREAILFANGKPNGATPDSITFNIGAAAAQTIAVTSALPAITDAVILNGTSQPGFSVTTPAPMIEINGAGITSGTVNGLTISAGNSTVRGLIINRFSGHGIELKTAGGNLIAGNRIGTSLNGQVDQGNGLCGLFINNVPNNTVGGANPEGADLNLISGNERHGIEISGLKAIGNTVRGNLIGTNLDGTTDLGNTLHGILISGAYENVIGSATARNVISGNNGHGIAISGIDGALNLVQNFLIGLNAAGTTAIPNGLDGIFISGPANTVGSTTSSVRSAISGNRHGVVLDGPFALDNKIIGTVIGTKSDGSGAVPNSGHGVLISNGGSRNRIGGNGAGNANIIAHNGGDGVAVVSGSRNQIRLNSIFANGGASGLGIDLGDNGPTANDATDGDSGANALQNYPELGGAISNGKTHIYATLKSTPNTSFALDFYVTGTSPAQGQTYLGGKTATTSSGGSVSVLFDTISLAPGQQITATAMNNSTGDSSEFSLPFGVQGNQAPQNVSVTPNNAVNAPNTARLFTTTYRDPNGAQDIKFAQLQVRRGLNGLRTHYDALTNRLFLFADDGVTLLGGFTPGYSGAGKVITNSQGSLDTQFTTVQVSGTDPTKLIIGWSLKAKPSYAGQHALSLFVQDVGGLKAGYDALGTWTVGSSATEPGQASSVRLSSAAAQVSSSRVVLSFSGALDATTAGEASRYVVTVNGQSVTVVSASYQGGMVTLNLPARLLRTGDTVGVAWQGLQDLQGRDVSGSTTVTAR